MKKLFCLALILTSSMASADYLGELYGSNQTEREIRWAWRHLADFVHSCRASADSCQKEPINGVVDQLSMYVPKNDEFEMPPWDALLVFVSEKERPDIFQTGNGEIHRVAVTEFKKGSKIFINTDRMNFPLEQWIGILAHEAVHHLGYSDDEQRLPDQVGSEIQKHVKGQLLTANLDQFKVANYRTVVFNSQAPGKGSATLISMIERSSDMGWSPNRLHPICNFAIEEFVSQYVTAPAWRVNRVLPEKRQVAVRGAGSMKAVCLNKVTRKPRVTLFPMNHIVYLQYDQAIDLESWKKLSPTLTYTQDETSFGSPEDYQAFGPMQTFYVLSTTHQSLKLSAGQSWKTQLVVQGTDGFQPNRCDLFFSGSQYSYITRDGLPAVNEFTSCRVTPLGNNQWQLDGETVLPREARPDFYYIAAAAVMTDRDGRMAVPTFPSYIEVLNPEAPPRPVIRQIRVAGLPSAQTFRGQPAKESHLAQPNQSFTVTLLVEGPQAPSEYWFDLTLWLALQGNLTPMQGTGGTESFPMLVKNESAVKTAKGTEVRFQMVMPGQISGYPLAAIKMKRFYMKTSDFSWVEIENLDLDTLLIINPAFGN